MRSSSRLIKREFELRLEVEEIPKQEELLCFQKACCKWLVDGDRNTKYFHQHTLSRRKYHKISTLRHMKGNWCYDKDCLESMAVEHFSSLYIVDNYIIGDFLIKGCFPKIA